MNGRPARTAASFALRLLAGWAITMVWMPGSQLAMGQNPDAFDDLAVIQPVAGGTVWHSGTGADDRADVELVMSAEPDPLDWLADTQVAYDGGFVIASRQERDLKTGNIPYVMRITGWAQLRHAVFNSDAANTGANQDLNQYQLKRGRLIFAGSVFNPDMQYFMQIDGRSSSGDQLRLLDFFLNYDLGHDVWNWEHSRLRVKAGKYKMPFSLARYISGQQFEFTDRSMASMYFDVNRSFGVGLYGEFMDAPIPWNWEAALFNGLVTGGAETGSAGTLDNNFAQSVRLFFYPVGQWGASELADFEGHRRAAIRSGVAVANSTIDRFGTTEFDSIRVVDSGQRLSTLLSPDISQFTVYLFAFDGSIKYCGWSATAEVYFRRINEFQGAPQAALNDYGYWLQVGKFVVPQKLELLARWSRIVGNSGTLGLRQESSDEFSAGAAWYIRGQHAKLVMDVTYLNGASIDSASLDITPGDIGWLFRSQLQFAF